MSTKDIALKELGNIVHTNYYDKQFPQGYLGIHTTERHIQIYNLISEYIELSEDVDKVTSTSVKSIIQNRRKQIRTEIMHFWIATDEEMIIPKKVNEDETN